MTDLPSTDRLVCAGLDEGVFPGAVVAVARGDQLVFLRPYGYANRFSRQVVTSETVFDLASLTKPLAMTLAVMALAENARIDLDAPLAAVAGDMVRGTDKADITPAQLLAHTSGLPAYRPYFWTLSRLHPKDRKAALRSILMREPLLTRPGDVGRYSDLGFMLLQMVVDEITGERLDGWVMETIYRPLGISDLFFVGMGGMVAGRPVAATEWCPWRRCLVSGRVHDENADAIGGVAGHAGLFGTAGAVAALVSELMATFTGRRETRFSPAWVRRFFQRQPGSGRSLGFDTPSPAGSSAGTRLSAHSVGHLGFTGTSFWMDLDREIGVVLLTNRVHPTRRNGRIRAFRPRFHDAVMDDLLGTPDAGASDF